MTSLKVYHFFTWQFFRCRYFLTSRRAADLDRDVSCLQHDGEVDGEHEGDVAVAVVAVVEDIFGGCGTDTGDLASGRRLLGEEEHIMSKIYFFGGIFEFQNLKPLDTLFLRTPTVQSRAQKLNEDFAGEE